MKIAMIAAMAHNRVIGAKNTMPWHLPADLAHFKRITFGKPVVMGRKTYQSIGKALPGRTNIVISRNSEFSPADAIVVTSCDEALEAAGNVDELMVIGGGTIYSHFLPKCDRLYITEIDVNVDGDTHFPDFQKEHNWRLIESQSFSADDKNPYPYTFITWDRQGGK